MTPLSRTTDPAAKTWVEIPAGTDFPIQNLPFGVFDDDIAPARIGIRIGDNVLDLQPLAEVNLIDRDLFPGGNLLDNFIGLDAIKIREQVFELLREDNGRLRDQGRLVDKALIPIHQVTMLRPMSIGAFVDFYASENHASNVGKMFRPQGDPLLPNWKHLPVGYNGRASTVYAGDIPIVRPRGQFKPPDAEAPIYGATRALDFELEVGFLLAQGNNPWHPIEVDSASDHILGLVLVNDWSARDIQSWEYQPLGPFLGKSFATTMSPWVVTLDALEPWAVHGAAQNPEPLPYLRGKLPWHYDLNLEVAIQTRKMTEPQTITRTNFRTMYWSIAQMLAHQTVNGTHVQEGDLYASGTVSGSEPGSFGSMLELTWRGSQPITMEETGETRAFLEDGDTVILRGWCQGDGYRVGLGELRNQVVGSVEEWHGLAEAMMEETV